MRSRRADLAAALLAAGLCGAPAAAESRPLTAPGGTWLRYPLPGAEVKSLASEPRTPGLFYAGTALGGVYRSTDGGRTWSAPPGGAPFPGYSVTSLLPDPQRVGTVWAGLTGVVKGGILVRSDDAARTWSVVRRWEERAEARVVAVTLLNGRKVVAVGGDTGLEVSEDGGVTWRPSRPPLDPGSGVAFLAFHPLKSGVLYSGSYRHPFRSTDLGRSWKRIAGGMVEDTQVFHLDFSPTDPDDIWAATCGWVYRTTDGAATWRRYKDGLADRRTHVVVRDPRDPARVLAGTTGGLFESRDAGKSFRRISRESTVVNALVFDPANPAALLVATEAEGIFRSEDGGLTLLESNAGLSEARVSAVAVTASGRVAVARAADGGSGGLWGLDPASGKAERIASAPAATIRALLASGERLLAGTPDGVWLAAGPGAPFARVLGVPAHGFAAGPGRLFAATDAGAFESRDGGASWSRVGDLRARVESVMWSRSPGTGSETLAVRSSGRTLWWNGRDFGLDALRGSNPRPLTGGFGRPRASTYRPAEPIGLAVDMEKGRLLFRVPGAGADVTLALPERGLNVAGWAGDPRSEAGLYLATIGRGLFRFVPSGAGGGSAVGELSAPAR
ncbi:MAG: WD40/YVTN/BNR-like repeat-containing protein [Thermoanaerobaculia bacterium]